MSDILPILRELANAFGPSGFENEVRAMVRTHVAPYADAVSETILGNLIVTRRGADPEKTLLVDAHLDEVGLIVSHVEANGFLRFGTLGSLDPRVVPSHRVRVRARDGSKHVGVVGVTPPHVTSVKERQRVLECDELFIDLGCSSAREVEALGVGVGSPAIMHAEFTEIAGGRVTGKSFDDRVGCALLIELLRGYQSQTPPVNLVASFTTQEETGGLGAIAAAHVAAPQAALCLEGTTAVDTPGVPDRKNVCRLGRGPAVTVADARTIVPEKMIRFIERQANEGDIPFQLKTPKIGGTNGMQIERDRAGVLTGIVSTPCRYIHSSTSVLDTEDLRNTAALLRRFVDNAAGLWE